MIENFNATSVCWGSSSTNLRGESIKEWAASLDLVILNHGSVPICIRAQSTSIVDLSWGSADVASGVVDWRVASTIETLSDYALIVMELNWRKSRAARHDNLRKCFPRWSTKNMDHDLLTAAIILKDWLRPQPELRGGEYSVQPSKVADRGLRCGCS